MDMLKERGCPHSGLAQGYRYMCLRTGDIFDEPCLEGWQDCPMNEEDWHNENIQ